MHILNRGSSFGSILMGHQLLTFGTEKFIKGRRPVGQGKVGNLFGVVALRCQLVRQGFWSSLYVLQEKIPPVPGICGCRGCSNSSANWQTRSGLEGSRQGSVVTTSHVGCNKLLQG